MAIAKRLLAARMAGVTVWAIAADDRSEAAGLRRFLIKLSGRQMRHKTAFTYPARLAGLWVFLSMLEVMEAYSQEELDGLTAIARQFLGKVVQILMPPRRLAGFSTKTCGTQPAVSDNGLRRRAASPRYYAPPEK